ncbi:hypothetical protein V6N12_044167 [Hibiscus sabdariffa]|uniref:Uncharacterized protein n=1 Tax=Hibiscus sabdariffa TaxID=183260 RepID=A0ABR2DHG5_9ROSI
MGLLADGGGGLGPLGCPGHGPKGAVYDKSNVMVLQPIKSDPVQVVGQAGSNNEVVQADGVPVDSGSSAIPPASRLQSPGYSSSREHCSGGVLENVSPAQEVTSHGSVDCSFGHEVPTPVSNEGVSANLECANEGVVPQLRVRGRPMVTQSKLGVYKPKTYLVEYDLISNKP